MEINALGDSALIIRVRAFLGRKPEEVIEAVLQAQRRLEAAKIPGVIECAPGYTSVGLFFDPMRVSEAGVAPEKIFDWLKAKIEIALAQKSKAAKSPKATMVEIPVCYEGEFAPDLAAVAEEKKLSLGEIVRRHSAAKYRVYCVGFLPGFAYLGGLPRELATPRRATPRTQVPAGSLGIGGAQTGIYPTTSPGGWNLIGRTPLRLFDLDREPPALLETGVRVKFRAITRDEFDRIRQQQA